MAPRRPVANSVPDQQTIELLSNNFFRSVTGNKVNPNRLRNIAKVAAEVADNTDLDITICVQAANIAYLAFTATLNHGGYLSDEQLAETQRVRQTVVDYDEKQKNIMSHTPVSVTCDS
ncbi:MAG: hypothetical protein Q7T41_01805 [Candidatus Saccharibacteria bacterium]|nr:hypothetical protein [Candidatus Saccharibacteria bacterium]